MLNPEQITYKTDDPVNEAFTKALPKVELHAHLTGSISPQCLHEIWLRKKAADAACDLEDPVVACRPGKAHHDVFTFFPLFDKYIYNLCSTRESVAFATRRVLEDFERDGVRYLELRTTPREALANGLTKEIYIETVLDAVQQHSREHMSTYLILSVDRRNTLEQSMHVVNLALRYRSQGVVGIDLCGNPLKGDVAIFAPAFALAKANGLKITLHFAEVPESSTVAELHTLLSYEPDRIGHVINVPADVEVEIETRQIGLELCLSCNVHAKLTLGDFADHHLGKWLARRCPISLCTDDVGVFGSPVSNEYLLAAQHFGLSRIDIIRLARRAVPSLFGGAAEKDRMHRLLHEFESRFDRDSVT